jgi:hypothetical protein
MERDDRSDVARNRPDGDGMPRKYELKNPPSLEVRQARAKKAAAARHSLDSQVKRIAERADELTPEQRRTLLEALGGTTEP